jgi:hypothetical protein
MNRNSAGFTLVELPIVAAYAGAATAAAEVITINTTRGVDVPTQYGTFAVNAAGIIRATVQNINAGVNTKTMVLTPNWATNQWCWSGTIDAACLLRS